MHAIGAAQSGALKNVIATTQAQRAAGSAGSDAPELTQEARDAVDRRTFEAEVEVFAQRHAARKLTKAVRAIPPDVRLRRLLNAKNNASGGPGGRRRRRRQQPPLARAPSSGVAPPPPPGASRARSSPRRRPPRRRNRRRGRRRRPPRGRRRPPRRRRRWRAARRGRCSSRRASRRRPRRTRGRSRPLPADAVRHPDDSRMTPYAGGLPPGYGPEPQSWQDTKTLIQQQHAAVRAQRTAVELAQREAEQQEAWRNEIEGALAQLRSEQTALRQLESGAAASRRGGSPPPRRRLATGRHQVHWRDGGRGRRRPRRRQQRRRRRHTGGLARPSATHARRCGGGRSLSRRCPR